MTCTVQGLDISTPVPQGFSLSDPSSSVLYKSSFTSPLYVCVYVPQTRTQTCTLTHAHVYNYKHTGTHTHTHTYIHTLANKHTHSHPHAIHKYTNYKILTLLQHCILVCESLHCTILYLFFIYKLYFTKLSMYIM